MRQRVSIARAFAVEPEILLCDEPFSSLDEMTARDLRAEFVRLVKQNGKTAVFITHHINEAMDDRRPHPGVPPPGADRLRGAHGRGREDGPAAQAIRDEILKVLGLEAKEHAAPA